MSVTDTRRCLESYIKRVVVVDWPSTWPRWRRPTKQSTVRPCRQLSTREPHDLVLFDTLRKFRRFCSDCWRQSRQDRRDAADLHNLMPKHADTAWLSNNNRLFIDLRCDIVAIFWQYLQYFGHITRGSAGQLALTVLLEGIMEGLRHQGRTRRQWILDMAANTFS